MLYPLAYLGIDNMGILRADAAAVYPLELIDDLAQGTLFGAF